jgi:hypothetical protein
LIYSMYKPRIISPSNITAEYAVHVQLILLFAHYGFCFLFDVGHWAIQNFSTK